MKRLLPILLILAVIGGFGFIAWQQNWFRLREAKVAGESSTTTTEDPGSADKADASGGVVALGRLEPASGVVDVLAALGDRVEELTPKEGDAVEAGKEIGHFESRTLRQLEVALAMTQLQESESRMTAELDAAQKKLASAKIGEEGGAELAELDVESQAAQIELLKLHRDQAKADLARLEKLQNTPTELVSKQEVEHQTLAAKKAAEEVGASQAALERIKKGSALKQKSAAADRTAAEAGIEQARRAFPIDTLKQQLALAQERLKQATLTAPVNGTVLKIYTPKGSSVTQRPVLQIADLTQMVCIAEVYDNEIHRIRQQQEVTIESKTFQDASGKPKVLHGQVSRIGRTVASPALKAIDPYAPVDRHVIEVRIDIRPEDIPQAARFINLQVDVKFASTKP
ncbi:MAG: efflux RND transporter periplasmic adaptor subunit [Pirellulaceae bacterium]